MRAAGAAIAILNASLCLFGRPLRVYGPFTLCMLASTSMCYDGSFTYTKCRHETTVVPNRTGDLTARFDVPVFLCDRTYSGS